MFTMEREDIWNGIRPTHFVDKDGLMGEILIVDDDPIVRHFVHRMLRIQGYTCTEVEHGLEAMNLLRTHRPRLIITDQQMPVMTGIELLENLVYQREEPAIPTILLAKDDEYDVFGRAKELGVHAVLSKPLDYRKIIMAVSAALS
ncbi:response regulator [Nitrospira sp. M1]